MTHNPNTKDYSRRVTPDWLLKLQKIYIWSKCCASFRKSSLLLLLNLVIWTNGRMFKISKEGDQTDKKNGEKTRILDLMWPVTSYFSALCFKWASNYQPPNKEHAKQSGLFSRDHGPSPQVLPLNQNIWRVLLSMYVCVCSFYSAKQKYDNVHGTQAGVQHKRSPSVSMFGECHSTCARAQRLTHIPSILPPLEPAVKTFLSIPQMM